MAWPESSCEFETGPHAAQNGLLLTMYQQVTLIFWSFRLYLLSAGMAASYLVVRGPVKNLLGFRMCSAKSLLRELHPVPHLQTSMYHQGESETCGQFAEECLTAYRLPVIFLHRTVT